MAARRCTHERRAAVGTALEMGLLLAYWELMARFHETQRWCALRG
jgi:hypothetical protein